MIEYRELLPEHWPALETLFGVKGACGGCWCQTWRVEHGGKTWEAIKGEPARREMKRLVTSGTAHGILAFEADAPVAWCSFGPRADFPRLKTMRAYQIEDADDVWSVTCFFIAKRYRGQGVARGLLQAALEAMRRRGVRTVEGYPVPLAKDGNKLPPAFTWTGPEPVFEELGFTVVQRLSPSRPLVRLVLNET